ncbi:LpqN/LpqT family lipoprotein [Mycobacterium sp. CVI_P3]|uniref:LpqN/LpqT family lipoprotein n=1 Tax=Mycobacterium pinniadriaticum TaxID=2994102 RepID=A0ABT3SPI2_9MYCO|nr:LpqN/LpqT family lipoprotein [Mycobacterium pinniadriaticum]MCX2934836.1 LpqN/LpqT family lipoprotein [Mycobacterium pinniadriaticum]MCX2941247.1 LpqN/LpqT family lipoprotein [Mycobacterium pinniadriaticum]
MSAVLAAALVVAIAGCSEDAKPTAVKCAEVSVPLADVPTRTDQEPRLRIPAPQGWERTTKLDSETIRFALRDEGLTEEGFTPNAVVTLQKVSADVGKPQQILDAQDQQLVAKLKVKDVKSAPAQVCGSPAQSTTYTAPAMGKIPARSATSLAVVYQAGDVNYVTTVTVQTIKPDNPTYAADSAAIIKGFQVLPPK